MGGRALGVAESEPVLDALTVTGATELQGNVGIGNATTDTIGFYGSTKVAQPAGAGQGSVTTTGTVSTAGIFGFTTSTQANAIITLLNQIRSDLVTLGLLKGSA